MSLRIANLSSFSQGDSIEDFLPPGVTVESLLNQDTRKSEDVEVVYMTEADERVRPEHAALHGTVWDINDPNRPIPPLGFGCRCWEEYRAKDKAASERTGLEVAPKDPPEPGNEALEGFWSDAKQSQESDDPGSPVTPVDTFGRETGNAIEDKKIKPEEAFNEGGDVRPASEVKNLADALVNKVTKKQVISATASLQEFAIGTQSQKRVIKLAQETLALKPTLKDSQALFDAVMKLKPGRVASVNPAQTRKNARKVAKLIRRAFGPLNGNA